MEYSFRYNVNFIALAAALSGLLFGYDAGIISGAILFIEKSFALTNVQTGLIVSAVPFGALLLAATVGRISDWFGRKKILFMTAIFFLVGSLICAFAINSDYLIFGRLLLGFAVGMSSTLSPIYIAEIAEKEQRGKLVTLFLISVNFGIFVSYLINFMLVHTASWRLMLGLGVVPAIILSVFVLLLPESPRWLALRGKIAEAKKILEKTHGAAKAEAEFAEIQQSVIEEKNFPKKLIFTSFFKVMWLGALIGIFTQAVGINAIIYYAPTIFKETGFHATAVSILATVGIGFTVTLAAIIASRLLDKFGRRKLLLNGLAGIISSLVIIIAAFQYVHNPMLLGWLALIGTIAFVACQGLSVGPACFLLPSEVFPAKVRGIGMGISITFNWLTNFLVALLFPVMLGAFGIVAVFKIFLLLSIIGWIVFYLLIPETKNVSLEKIEMNILSGKNLRWIGEN